MTEPFVSVFYEGYLLGLLFGAVGWHLSMKLWAKTGAKGETTGKA